MAVNFVSRTAMPAVRFSGASLVAIALFGAASATAQEAASEPVVPESVAAPTEIVVTANKREQRLNDVGLTITALSGDDLAQRGITTLEDLATAVPGLSFAQSANNTPILTLRGIGFNESSLGVYPAVSVYVDQAPLPFPVLASHSAFDIDRVEVLKGPQGTLFGQNSTGGAINYIAARPTQDFEAGATIGFGRFNELKGDVYVSGPLAENLRGRIAVSGVNSDGWQVSYTRPFDRNGATSYVAGRALLDWDPVDSIRLALSLTAWRDRSEPQAGQFILLQPQTPGDEQPQELAAPFSPETPRAADWATGINEPRSNRRFIQPALRADIDVTDGLTLTSLTSYSDYGQTQTTDGDGSALIVTDIQENDGDIRSFNQELRLANDAGSTFRWVLGANYENSKTFERQLLVYPDNNSFSPSKNFIFQNFQQGRQNIENYAAFGNLEYDLTSQLTVKAAARYTESRNRAEICGFDAGDGQIAGLFNFLGSILGTVPFTPVNSSGVFSNNCFSLNQNNVPSGEPFRQTLKEDNVSWRAGVDYKASRDTLLYANISRGYKAGSFPILAAATVSQFNPVTQESVTAYEAGVKIGLFDRLAQFNAAAFYYDYKDKQVLTKVADPIFGILDQLRNIPKSRVIGAEAELTVRPADGLTIGAAVTYLDTKIQEYTGVDYVGVSRNFAGEPLPFAPEWNYGINIDYRAPATGIGVPFFGAGLRGQSASDTVPGGSTIAVTGGLPTRILPGLVYPFRTNAYALVDLRAGIESDDKRWSVMVYGKNIFDKYYYTNVVTASDFSARFTGRPATYGVTVTVKY